MRDREVAAAIVAGDPAGLAEAYDRYADPLYNFCRAILHEPADAADAVHDTFVIAACRLSGLEDPERLRPWLYAVARNECLRKLRGGSRQEPLEKIADITDEATDIAADAEQAELRALVREALNGLGPAEREVLELQIRHGLTSSESASILGISRNHLHALLSRARDQLKTSLGVLAVARTGRRDCPVLDAMLGGWDGRLTILLRKRVNQHVGRCVVCSERRHGEMVPAMFLGASPLIALPLAAALHPAFRAAVLRAAVTNPPAAVAHPAALTHTAFGSGGFPRPVASPRVPWWHPRPVHAGAAAGTAAAVASVVTIVASPPHHVAHAPGGGPAGGTAPGIIAGGTGGAAPTTSAGSSGSRASGTAGPSALPTMNRASPITDGASATTDGISPTTVAPTSTAAPTSTSPSATASTAPQSGTLSVSPATLDVAPPASGTITLAASDGPVAWSVSEPPGLAKKVIVSPMSGALAAGATTTVSVTVDGHGKMHVHLVFSPGGSTVTVVIS